MTDKLCVSSILQLAGRIILENGGEAYRVEDTVQRLGYALGLNRIEVYSVPGSIIFTMGFADGTTDTQVVRCKKRTVHLEKVDRANRISREVAQGALSAELALEKLRCIAYDPDGLSFKMRLFASVVSAGGFSAMFMGSLWDALMAILTAVIVRIVLHLLYKRDENDRVVSNLLGGAITAILPQAIGFVFSLPVTEAAMAGALMQLLPGLAMTTAVQDLLKGDITSGVGNVMNAMLTAVLVAGGAMVGGRLMLLF